MISQQLLPEFEQEIAKTRKHLEGVPEDRFEWAPHAKSMTLGRLAGHLAEIPFWVGGTLEEDEMDMAPTDGSAPYTRPEMATRDQVLAYFDENVVHARKAIEAADDATFMGNWALKAGDETLFEMPRIVVIRNFVLNHLIHHRGQLSVYLRLCDCPVPQSFGPTADEPNM